VLEVNEIEGRILSEIEADPDSAFDPFWFPTRATVSELSAVLAHSYLLKTGLLNMGADVGYIEDANVAILKRLRWLRNRGDACIFEIPPIDVLRRRYCAAAAILAEEPEHPIDLHEIGVREVADLAMGACHMLAREFHHGDDALFNDP